MENAALESIGADAGGVNRERWRGVSRREAGRYGAGWGNPRVANRWPQA